MEPGERVFEVVLKPGARRVEVPEDATIIRFVSDGTPIPPLEFGGPITTLAGFDPLTQTIDISVEFADLPRARLISSGSDEDGDAVINLRGFVDSRPVGIYLSVKLEDVTDTSVTSTQIDGVSFIIDREFAGRERVEGTEGADALFSGADVAVDVRAGAGDDKVFGGNEADVIFGGMGADELFGGAGNDNLYGGSGADLLFGDEGRDNLRGGAGDDVLFGEEGQDSMLGNSGDDLLFGGGGDDQMAGGTGSDALFGGEGANFMRGNQGEDYIQGEGGQDRAFGGSDDDTIFTQDGNDVVSGGQGNDFVFGGDGDDRIFGGFSSSARFNPLNGDRIDGDDALFGGNGDDLIAGEAGNDFIAGGTGSDALDSGLGDDVMFGEEGDDTFRNPGGIDAIFGGAGRDIFDLGPDDDAARGTPSTTYWKDYEVGVDSFRLDFSGNLSAEVNIDGLSWGATMVTFASLDQTVVLEGIDAAEISLEDFRNDEDAFV